MQNNVYNVYMPEDPPPNRLEFHVLLNQVPLGTHSYICLKLKVGEIWHHQLGAHFLVPEELPLAIYRSLLSSAVALVVALPHTLGCQRQALGTRLGDIFREAADLHKIVHGWYKATIMQGLHKTASYTQESRHFPRRSVSASSLQAYLYYHWVLSRRSRAFT